MEIYSTENLSFRYPNSNNTTLINLSFSINAGEFVTICGPSGCGKTTLLRQLKPSLAPHGVKSGRIFFECKPLDTVELREQSQKIGFVLQNPENSIVTDKVWHELAFGLESLGMDTPTIRRRVAEMASFFGIQTWFHKNVSELSGGQKQMLNLASIMIMQPSVLILDEPTSQLDPIVAAEFLDIVGKINRELGVTVIITEHRLEDVFSHSDRVIVMDNGVIIADGTAQQVGKTLKENGHVMFAAMPVPMRIYASINSEQLTMSDCPVTVRDGKKWLSQFPFDNCSSSVAKQSALPNGRAPSIELTEVWFKYERDLPDVIKGLSFKAYSGEITAILGGNGTGKTTMLSLISAIHTPYRGNVSVNGTVAVLPQNPQSLFVRKSVEADLLEMLEDKKLSEAEMQSRIQNISTACYLHPIFHAHPYDLSGGEQQRAALAKVLLRQPQILLLDEPTKGLDAEFKEAFASILRGLAVQGVCVVLVSHDIEFCAEYADRCALFFDGSIVSSGRPREFFSGNSFYTTAANRMARHVLPDAVTADDVIRALGGTTEKERRIDNGRSGLKNTEYVKDDVAVIKTEGAKSPFWRICTAVVSCVALLTALYFAIFTPHSALALLVGKGLNISRESAVIWACVSVIAASLLVWALNARKPHCNSQIPPEKHKLSKRTLVASIMILLAIPLTIYIGLYTFGDRKYYFISALIIFETMLPFAMVFESRKPQAREIIVISVLVAVAVAGRAAFFMLPQFKPVAAMVIVAGVAFGGEAGFLVGALTVLVSNMFFGHGPWTPWQMFAFGIIGFLAGIVFRKGFLQRSRGSLCTFGFWSVFLIYGGIMNPAAVLMFQSHPNKEMFYLAYLQGIPFDLVHAISTVTFLAFVALPILEKLDRIKVKYGLVEQR